MAWHTTDPAKLTSVEDMEDAVGKVASLIPRGQGTMCGGFSHLFGGGYDSGYYSYKWAEVLEADVFERFLQNGLYDKKTAKGVLTQIYQAGGKIDPALLYKKLMGRDPDPEALFRREGIIVAGSPQTQKQNPAPKP
jgi:peptidyl-dipeptidase Dcp